METLHYDEGEICETNAMLDDDNQSNTAEQPTFSHDFCIPKLLSLLKHLFDISSQLRKLSLLLLLCLDGFQLTQALFLIFFFAFRHRQIYGLNEKVGKENLQTHNNDDDEEGIGGEGRG